MKQVLKSLFLFYFTAVVCFSVGYFAWKINRKYEAREFEVVITGKVDIFEGYDMYDGVNPVIATLDKGDEAKFMGFYSGHDFAGIEVELNDGRTGYIHYFRVEQNFKVIKKQDQ